jgi:hypothetical protein
MRSMLDEWRCAAYRIDPRRGRGTGGPATAGGTNEIVGTGSVSNRSVGGTRTPEYAPELDKLVGRPGLDPGTLGLKVPCSSG